MWSWSVQRPLVRQPDRQTVGLHYFSKSSKNLFSIVELHDKFIHGLFQCKSLSLTRRFASRQWSTFIIGLAHEYILSCNWETMIHRVTCSSGSDHVQIWSWSLGCHHGQFNDLWSDSQTDRQQASVILASDVKKTVFPLLSCMINLFMGSSNLKVYHWLDAPRLVNDQLSSLDSPMNI